MGQAVKKLKYTCAILLRRDIAVVGDSEGFVTAVDSGGVKMMRSVRAGAGGVDSMTLLEDGRIMIASASGGIQLLSA